MKFTFTDSKNQNYEFEIDKGSLVSYVNGVTMVIPVKQVCSNSSPWQWTKNDHFKMSKDAIEYIEKICKNLAFV